MTGSHTWSVSQVWLVLVATPGIGTEGDVTLGELIYLQDGTVVRCLEEDGHFAAVAIVEHHNVEGRAVDAVAVMSGVNDREFHGGFLSR
jgi:hypothetical protein